MATDHLVSRRSEYVAADDTDYVVADSMILLPLWLGKLAPKLQPRMYNQIICGIICARTQDGHWPLGIASIGYLMIREVTQKDKSIRNIVGRIS